MITPVSEHILNWQTQLATHYQALDPSASTERFEKKYTQGGDACSLVFEQGPVLEKAAINFSLIHGQRLPKAASKQRPELADHSYQVVGLSTICHPRNPHAPTSHANLRFFQVGNHCWFGGGFDLTPYIGYTEDAVAWHQAAHAACETLGPHTYLDFKQACDDYFFLPHREEHRGIGGLFFDDLIAPDLSTCFHFIQQVSAAYTHTYLQLLHRHYRRPYTEADRFFQCYRRGRYVEFNLLYDRGTHFGLQSKVHTPSVMSSMPPTVHWPRTLTSAMQQREQTLVKHFLTPKNWVNFEEIA